ncbi:MAG: DUF3788 domain-containing protein [Caldilineaceae bacterium]
MHERMMDKTTQPSLEDMRNWIGQPIADAWLALRQFLEQSYNIIPIFNAGGKRYGWNLQYRSGRRPLCELYPEQGSFTALVILGRAELDQALDRVETFGATVRQAVETSPRHHDGCWMYIRVADTLICQQDVQDIEALIAIKRKPSVKIAVA